MLLIHCFMVADWLGLVVVRDSETGAEAEVGSCRQHDMTLHTATPGRLGGGARAPHSPYHLHTPAALRGDTR